MRFADNCRGRRRVSYRKCWYEIPQGERWSAGVVGVSVRDSTSSTCGAWERRQQMNRFGAQAMKYWKTWLPSRYAGIEDPQMFFTNLGIQVQDEVAAGCLEWESRDRDQLNQLEYLARVGRLNAIKQSVTEAVLAELVWLEPEPGTMGPEPVAEPLDPKAEWVDEEGMPVDPSHPLHRMLEDDSVSPEQFRRALLEFRDQVRAKTSR